MDLQLTGKTALVTGASTPGIGRAIAAELAREGITVESPRGAVSCSGKSRKRSKPRATPSRYPF
jgi:3-oxoacyl-ACP reductase-like protein